MTLMFQPLLKYAVFTGRARRSEYWQFILFQFGVSFVFGFVGGLSGNGSGLNLLSALFGLAMWLPTLAVSVRRFHDINRTGWWVLFPSAIFTITLALFIAIKGTELFNTLSQMSQNGYGDVRNVILSAFSGMMAWVVLPTFLACIVTFIFHVTEGTKGPNRFGPDPKDGSSVDISVFDDDRIDSAIEEAKSGKRERDPNYKPVFDFTSPQPAVVPADLPAARPIQAPARQTPTFGKRR